MSKEIEEKIRKNSCTAQSGSSAKKDKIPNW